MTENRTAAVPEDNIRNLRPGASDNSDTAADNCRSRTAVLPGAQRGSAAELQQNLEAFEPHLPQPL